MKRRQFIQTAIAFSTATKMSIGETPFASFTSAAAFSPGPAESRPTSPVPMTLNRLPLLPRDIRVDEFSSYNRGGKNGDSDYYLYKDSHGDAVIFDAKGPGCVRSFWQTNIAEEQTLKFYFDGEAQPSLSIRCMDLYQGKHALFPAPLASFNMVGYCCDAKGGGCGNCFVPIPFAKSLKIISQGGVNFYHFIFETYPSDTAITTFSGREDHSYILRAFEQLGEELEPLPDLKKIQTSTMALESEGRLELLRRESAGTITRIEIEGDLSEEFLNSVEIEMQWDDSSRPDVRAPIGIFFGAAVRPENLKSLPTKVEKLSNGRLRLTNYFRMPFWRSGRVSLINRMSMPTGPITATLDVGPCEYAENETGYFCAVYGDGRTRMGRDWVFADAVGTGWFVGVVQTMNGGEYCEGNEHFVLDGAGMPQINGTGTEDYYLACLWPNRNFNLPFSGCVGDITQQPGPACYYRYHLEAPIPFYRTLDARIQHGGNSQVVSHYRSLGIYYLRKRPVMQTTDMIDVGVEASEHSHSYHASDSQLTGGLDAAYVGSNSDVLVHDRGRSHGHGEIRFSVTILPDNIGVRLRRRLDQAGLPQAADVYIDGNFVGPWYHANQNGILRWFDSELDLPPSLTREKESLQIRLVVQRGLDLGPFTDFRYEVLSIRR